MSKRYGLLGRNISYSFSRGYFNNKFENEKLDDCQYVNFDLKNLENFKAIFEDKNVKGLNVTIPYKQEVIPLLNHIDAVAEKIGAVNVIQLDKEKGLVGHNSDYYGFWNSLQEILDQNKLKQPKKALILGTGGASKAVAYALENNGITYQYVSRSTKENCISYDDLKAQNKLKNYQLIINCTPLGTFPNIENKPNLDYNQLSEEQILYDLIYNPNQTAFMKEGIKRKCTVSNGLRMLELQALKAWEIWNS